MILKSLNIAFHMSYGNRFEFFALIALNLLTPKIFFYHDLFTAKFEFFFTVYMQYCVSVCLMYLLFCNYFFRSEFIREDGEEKFWQFVDTVKELTFTKTEVMTDISSFLLWFLIHWVVRKIVFG